MLKKVKARNISGIYDEISVDFTKGDYEFLEENSLFDMVVNPAILIGANGSGKTTLLKIFRDLSALITREIEPKDLIHNFFVKENNENKSDVSEHDMKSFVDLYFDINGSEYNYYIEIDKSDESEVYDYEKKITKEHLKVDGSELNLLNDDFDKETNGNLPLLWRVGTSVSDGNIRKAYDYISGFVFLDSKDCLYGEKIENDTTKLILKHKDEIINIIRNNRENFKYGLPIIEEFIKEEFSGNEKTVGVRVNKNINFKYKFDSMFFSSGTRKLYELLAILSEVKLIRDNNDFNNNSLLLIDEIDAKLHTQTIKWFVDLAKEWNVQLIFSTHKTSLLKESRPDQIYVTRNIDYNVSYFRGSTIKNIRKIHNIEKLYLSGRFDVDDNEKSNQN